MRIFWGRKISKYQKKLLSCEKSAKSFELTLKKDIYLGYSGDTPLRGPCTIPFLVYIVLSI